MLVQEDINEGTKAGAQEQKEMLENLNKRWKQEGTPEESQLEPLTQTVLKG